MSSDLPHSWKVRLKLSTNNSKARAPRGFGSRAIGSINLCRPSTINLAHTPRQSSATCRLEVIMLGRSLRRRSGQEELFLLCSANSGALKTRQIVMSWPRMRASCRARSSGSAGTASGIGWGPSCSSRGRCGR